MTLSLIMALALYLVGELPVIRYGDNLKKNRSENE